MSQTDITWQAPEFEYREKTIAWYWTTIILSVVMLGVAVWQKNFLFAVFVVIGEILVLTWSGQEPPLVEFRLSDRGLTIRGRTLYPWSDIQNFSTETYGTSDVHLVKIHLRNRLRPPLTIRVPQSLFPAVYERFTRAVPEIPWEESLVEVLERFFGF